MEVNVIDHPQTRLENYQKEYKLNTAKIAQYDAEIKALTKRNTLLKTDRIPNAQQAVNALNKVQMFSTKIEPQKAFMK